MRSGFIGSRPPHLVPFSSFPLHTLLFLFLFMIFMSSLASCPFISLLSFFCAYNGPGLSVYAHIYVQLRFQVAQVSTMGVHRLSLCIWFLFHRNHTHFCPVVFLFMSSSFCPFCAHIGTLVLALILPPLGEACVCVTLGIIGILLDFLICFSSLYHSRGAVGILEVTAQRRHFKLAVIWNLDADGTHLREDDHHSFPFGPLCN